MSRSNKIFKLIQPQVPASILCGDYLFIQPTECIARGFFLDTTPHKDQMKLWRVVLPLHRPPDKLGFNYSKGISGENADLIHIDKNAYKQSADTVFERIRLHVEPLRKIQTPRDFMTYISWMAGNRMLPVRTDFGINHFLLGNPQEALRIFRQLEIDLDDYQRSTQEICRPLFRQVLDLLEHDPPGLHTLIRSWRDRNIERLGLSAGTTEPGLRLVR